MNRIFLFFIVVIFTASSCQDDEVFSECYLPAVGVNITINTDLPTNFHLKSLGSYSYLDGGQNGVILMHDFNDEFVALERTCTHLPDNSCSRIFVDSINLLLRCGTFENDTTWNECCPSQFEYSGLLRTGPARCNLQPYSVIANGSTLSIRN
jgi:Rieske Fe-S protein